ncbi:MAG TPA: 2OG-Fe dioxygenase family protein [Methylibium sp.]|nr:2OG-Fe dioxygenase family protein [Methylibium sp.]
MHVDLTRPLDRDTAAERLRTQGFCTLNPAATEGLCAQPLTALDALRPFWNDLPPDRYLKDGGHYRYRRHGSFVQTLAPAALEAVPHRAHWQPTTYNALHGGMERWFEPLAPAQVAQPAWGALVASLGELFAQARPPAGGRWYIEAHTFRIDTEAGVGRPTPEGAHRDGVDFVAVVFVGRHGVRGGETRVFDATGPLGVRFTLEQPWTVLLLDDPQVVHESTPIQPEDPAHPEHKGWRDTLVLTYRAGGFQDPR